MRHLKKSQWAYSQEGLCDLLPGLLRQGYLTDMEHMVEIKRDIWPLLMYISI